jgi:hypothetical protein
VVISFTKQNIRKEDNILYIRYIKRTILSPPSPKQVVNVYDLGYLEVEKDSPAEQLSSHYHIKRKEITSCQKKKKSTTKSIPAKEE